MPDYGLKIAEEFQRYLQTGERVSIEKYSAKELRNAVSKLSPYYGHNKLWFREIERRILDLTNDEKMRRERGGSGFVTTKSSWKELILAFTVGILCGILI